ncbi:MAG: hypothetical protein KF884_07190 [Fimbriimonadaceae bacterium]|nr:hypothetical protein [Fimbriimonadaceae bacterium]QYK57334.1 MAG: hypothetical protein KF884_07190 [Fimbriimonadaceae bacterium]
MPDYGFRTVWAASLAALGTLVVAQEPQVTLDGPFAFSIKGVGTVRVLGSAVPRANTFRNPDGTPTTAEALGVKFHDLWSPGGTVALVHWDRTGAGTQFLDSMMLKAAVKVTGSEHVAFNELGSYPIAGSAQSETYVVMLPDLAGPFTLDITLPSGIERPVAKASLSSQVVWSGLDGYWPQFQLLNSEDLTQNASAAFRDAGLAEETGVTFHRPHRYGWYRLYVLTKSGDRVERRRQGSYNRESYVKFASLPKEEIETLVLVETERIVVRIQGLRTSPEVGK